MIIFIKILGKMDRSLIKNQIMALEKSITHWESNIKILSSGRNMWIKEYGAHSCPCCIAYLNNHCRFCPVALYNYKCSDMRSKWWKFTDRMRKLKEPNKQRVDEGIINSARDVKNILENILKRIKEG